MADRDQASNSDFYHRQNHARFARVFYRMRLFHRYVNYTLASQYLLCFCDENSVKYCSWNPFCEFRNLDQWIQSSGILDEFIQVQFLFGEETQVLESSKITWLVHYNQIVRYSFKNIVLGGTSTIVKRRKNKKKAKLTTPWIISVKNC